ncbi:hypothetical protein [Fervidobacterium thailandense]|uniref:Uncharacterized protein n=1 Tax=Fervidobacterium thailandense TaxID=1008305 RepID=A0A1E3G133_9BACT|nr:hypothetical protein [Fervidobacterium thailandense]ODN29959.1 hypothetical protein A4H02_08110 [Fervidobacterium thailandense]
MTKPIVDPAIVFGNETSYSFPELFISRGLDAVLREKQHETNKIPCPLTPLYALQYPRESVEIFSAIGYVTSERMAGFTVLRTEKSSTRSKRRYQ